MLIIFQKERYKEKIRKKQENFIQKKERMRTRLAPDDDLLTPKRELILTYPILELIARLKSGDLDPVDVLEAYQVLIRA